MKKEKVTTLIRCNGHTKFHTDEDPGPEGWIGVFEQEGRGARGS